MEGHMRKNKTKLWLLLLSVLLCLQGCTAFSPDESQTTPSESKDSNPDGTVVGCYQNMEYTYLTDVDVSVLTTDLSDAYLLLMNKTATLGKDYVPASLTVLNCPVLESGRTYELESRAASALGEMLREMKTAGVTDIMVCSSYRSYQKQQSLYNHYVQLESSTLSVEAYEVLGYDYIKANYTDQGKTSLDHEDAIKVVLSYSAYPGTSEHQTGLCVDFITEEMGGELTVAFESTQAFTWLSENAHKFGFILRYPKEKESVTGYTYEPWHYRFVGREAATDIHLASLTLEEYLNLINQ